MLMLPLPPNPMNPLGVVSGAIATTATLAGLGVGVALGAGLLAVGAVLFRDRTMDSVRTSSRYRDFPSRRDPEPPPFTSTATGASGPPSGNAGSMST